MEQTEAILIRKQVWSDTSLIVTWLTPAHGKVRTLARAARRPGNPLFGKLDLFFRAEIAFAVSPRSSLHALREVSLLQAFDSSSVSSVFLCGYFAELADAATESGQPAPEVFDLLVRGIAHLRVQAASLRALEHFEVELCRVLGVHDGRSHPLATIESYCGRIPASRSAALRMIRPLAAA